MSKQCGGRSVTVGHSHNSPPGQRQLTNFRPLTPHFLALYTVSVHFLYTVSFQRWCGSETSMYGGVQEMYTLLCCCISVFFRSFVGRSFVRSLVVVAFRTIVRSFVQLFRGARCRSFFVVVRRSLFVVRRSSFAVAVRWLATFWTPLRRSTRCRCIDSVGRRGLVDGRLRRTWNTFGTTSQYLCKRRHSAFLQPSDKACPRRDPVIYLSSECTLPLQSEDHMVLDRACQQRNFVVAGGLGLCGGCELATFSRNPCARCKPSTPHTTGELWFGELTRSCFSFQCGAPVMML